jgi:hypothetical protein
MQFLFFEGGEECRQKQFLVKTPMGKTDRLSYAEPFLFVIGHLGPTLTGLETKMIGHWCRWSTETTALIRRQRETDQIDQPE